MCSEEDKTSPNIYIDAFAGGGIHKSKNRDGFIPGSPVNALLIDPPFKEYHFIDLDLQKVDSLEKLSGERDDVHIHPGDCNEILLNKVFPRAKYNEYKRALCILDPYGLHLDWKIMYTAGRMGSVEIFLNFPIADMNRNVLHRDPDSVSQSQIDRMNKFWGDESWRRAAYKPSPQQPLWGKNQQRKTTNEQIAAAFQQRLKDVAGFIYVPDPVPMKNSQNAVVYYLFFASHKPAAKKIVNDIFKKYSA